MPNILRAVTIMAMNPTRRLARRLTPVALIIILVMAAALRFYNLNWDNGIFAHPDERSTVAFYAPTIRWPDDPSSLLDPRRSTLNPFWDVANQVRRSYTYGHFPLYTLVLVAAGLHYLAPTVAALPFDLPAGLLQFMATAQSTHGYALVGRALMALADLGTVYLVFLLGKRLYGVGPGLLAAALSAFTVLQIQLAHFFAVDPVSTTFTLLALYGAILMYSRRSVGAAVITGVGIALAVASKFSAAPVAFAPLAAVYFSLTRRPSPPESGLPSPPNPLPRRMAGLALLALGVAVVLFAVTSPFVLLDFENFKQAVLVEQGNMVRGIADFPFTRQYRNTPAYWYFIVQQIRWGMGWPLGLLAFGGLLWVGVKAIRGRAHPGEWIVLGWIVLYFGPTGLFLAKFMRYMVPVVPLFTLFGAGLVAALWQAGSGNRKPTPITTRLPQKFTRAAAVTISGVALAGAVIWSLAFVNGVYGTNHPWVTFSRWIYANVPDGACLAWEHWDDRLPTDLPEPGGNPAAHRYYQPQLPMYNDDTPEKYQLVRDTLLNCDYVVLATNRLWRTIPRLPERYPMSTRFYQALFAGKLGFEQVYSVETPPRLGPWSFPDQEADESFTVYDHPKPILFKKTRQLSAAEWDAILDNTWRGAVTGYIGRPTLLMRLSGANNTPAAPAPRPPAREGKSLMLQTPVNRLPVVNDYHWNGPANTATGLAILVWWLAVMVTGLAVWPTTFWLFNKLPDRGYGLAKSLGLLLVGYFVWVGSSLGWWQNRLGAVIGALAVLIALNAGLAVKHRRALGRFLTRCRRNILLGEAVFALVYLFFVYLRILNPDLWQPWLGGEKMLEIGFLNAIVKSAYMPPYDPFFAGGIINYYYYGLFLVGILIKLTGIQPSIAFNLAVPTLAGLTALNVFSLATNLTANRLPFGRPVSRLAAGLLDTAPGSGLKAIAAGLLAVLFVVFIGNLEGAAQFLRELARLSTLNFHSAIPGLQTLVLALEGLLHLFNGQSVAVYNYWDPTRVIPATINEFPYFSFLFADLHPHMIGIPFTVLFLSLAYNWLRPNTATQTPWPAPNLSLTDVRQWAFAQLLPLLRWLALPFVLGAVAIINTWDLPTYLGLMVAAFLLSRYRRIEGRLTPLQAGFLLARGAVFAATLLGVTYLLYAPFFAAYQAIDVGFGLVHTKTVLGQHLKIWGFFLLVIVSWLWVSLVYPATRNRLLRNISLGLRRWNVWPHLVEIQRQLVRQNAPRPLPAWWGPVGAMLVALLLAVLGYTVPAYLLPLVVLALLLLLRPETSAETACLGLLAFTGLLVLLGVEFFYLRDFLGGGEYYRMNTLFKFFIQVWIMFGLFAAVTLPHLWEWAWRWPWPAQLAWRGAVMLLLLACLIYPALGTRTRINDRFPGDHNRPAIGTLDGLAYMTVGVFEWPAGRPIELKYDYQAIRWLQQNVTGTPIIAEAKVGYYREGGMRVAAYTGLPSVLGGLHQSEQRYASQVGQRDLLVSEFWATPDPRRTLELMEQLDVSYIYLGQIERITHGEHITQKFEQLQQQGALELVFENEKTRIYKRVL